MGRRSDLGNRPELRHGTVDFVATPEYIVRKPCRPHLIFALDSSRAAVQSGAFLAYLEAVKEFLHRESTERRYSRVAILTFDKSIQFYDVRSSLVEPQLLVVSDVHEPFVPLHEGLFFDPVESAGLALSLLDRLPRMFAETRIIDSCTGAAVSVAIDSLKKYGGKVVLMQTTLPNHGIGSLKNREGLAQTATDKVNPLFVPQGDFYPRFAKLAAAQGISFSLFCTPSSFLDLATIGINQIYTTFLIQSLGALATCTGGMCVLYSKFSYDAHLHRFVQEVCQNLFKPFVYDCLMRMRCGAGLEVSQYIGNYSTVNSTDYQYAILDCDQSLLITFTHDSKLSESEKMGFQCAVLYTSSDGQRRIRVLNMSLSCTSNLANVFRMVDLDAVVQYLVKTASKEIVEGPMHLVTSQIITKSTHMLSAYRKLCASSMSSGQLVLPDALKLLPIYVLAILKLSAYSATTSNIDVRMQAVAFMSRIGIEILPPLLYPRLFPLHRLLEQNNDGPIPECLRLSQEYLERHGIYVLENGLRMVIWIGNMVDPELLSMLFGVTQTAAIRSNIDTLPELDNPFSLRVRSLLHLLQQQRSNHLWLQVIRQGLDPYEPEWNQLLIEDSYSGSSSYVDFLCRIHGNVQQDMNSVPSLAERAAMLSFLH